MLAIEAVSLILDILLVIAAILAYLARPRIGGELAHGLRILLVGVIILGFAHLLETGLFAVFQLDFEVNEVAHRLFVGIGFIMIIAGFSRMRRAFAEE
jgi:hypothetical protein